MEIRNIVKQIEQSNTDEYRNKYNTALTNKIAQNIEPNIEDFHLADIETKANKYDELQQRIDKAIEYIKEHIKYECDDAFNGMEFYSNHLYDFSSKELLSILERGKE